MGVLGLTNFVETFYSEHCQKTTQMHKRITVDHLYFDMNSVLHIAVREENLFLKSIDHSGQKMFIKNVAEATWNRLREVLSLCYPAKSIILAFDGPVNLAKLRQQQERRLRQSVGEQCITSGYYLMPLLENEIVNRVGRFLAKAVPPFGKHKKYNQRITLLGMRSPGEGEIKIARQVYLNSVEFGVNTSHMIVGNDSDLFMVSMGAISTHNISLLNLVSLKIYCIGSIIRSCLFKVSHPHENTGVTSSPLTISPHRRNETSVYNTMICLRLDFIFLFSLSGNDYLSPVNGFNARNVWLFYQRFLQEKNIIHSLQDSTNEDTIALSTFLILKKPNLRKKTNAKRCRKKFLLEFRKESIVAFLDYAFPSLKNERSKSNALMDQKMRYHTRIYLTDYFHALSWCLKTIITGKCPNNRFLGTKYVPTVDEIRNFLISEDSNEISRHTGSRKQFSTFLPIVHFHLAVQSPVLLNPAILSARIDPDMMAPSNSMNTGSNATWFSHAHGESMESLLVSRVLHQGEHVLRLLKAEFPDFSPERLSQESCVSTLESGKSEKFLVEMQFTFDSTRIWTARSFTPTQDGNIPMPQKGFPELKQPVEKPILLELNNVFKSVPPLKIQLDSSLYVNIIESLSTNLSRGAQRRDKRRITAVNLDVDI